MSSNSNKLVSKATPGALFFMLLFLVGAFLVVLLVFTVKYLQENCPPDGKLPFVTYVSGMDPRASSCVPTRAEVQYEVREKKIEQEPYLIEDQIYSYPEAQQKCSAYGATLATYPQLVSGYNKGMYAPHYGWTDGKKAFQVMDPCAYDKLVREGRDPAPPGVQGGKFPEHLRFGAWCYGIRPPGQVVKPKSNQCPSPSVCQRNPDACLPLKSDDIAPFAPGKTWSMWGDNA